MQEEVPYYDYEEGWKKRFELTIPLLLLILVVLVLAWKMQWLCGVPGLSGIACGGAVHNVLVIGDDPNVELMLSDVGLNFNHEILMPKEINNLRDPDYLKKYDLIILTENTGLNGEKDVLPNAFRGYLAQALVNKKFILFKAAGSKDSNEPSINGWTAGGLGEFVPVSCKTTDCKMDSHSVSQMKFMVQDVNNPIFQGYNPTEPIGISGEGNFEYLPVNLVGNARSLGVIESQVGSQTLSEYGVVEGSSGVTGKTIYFSYNPARTPTLFKNAVKYLLGGSE